jgi:hypothetical protein
MDMVRKLRHKIYQKIAIPLYSFKAAALYKQSFVKTWRRMMYLYGEKRFFAKEAYTKGLLNLNMPQEQSEQFISQRFLSKVHRAVNPHCWQSLSHNKGMFYRHCQLANLPIPSLYAIFFKSQPGYRPSGSFLNTKEQWLDFIRQELPNEFAVKQLIGVGGRGFNLFEKQKDSIVDAKGENYTWDQFYDYLADVMASDSIIQARVRNHPDIIQLSGTDYLQTMRMITLVNQDNTVRVIFAYQKLILGENIIDNDQGGSTGNVKALIDLDAGTLGEIGMPSGFDFKYQGTHPVTGNRVDGFAIPYWLQSVELVQQAAIAFLPIRTIGWDVAITADGPVIIEGNIWWNYVNQFLQMARLSKEIFAAAGKQYGKAQNENQE